MTTLSEIIHSADLSGQTTRTGAQKALRRARREAKEELAERAQELLVDWFVEQLGQVRHSRNARARFVARRKRFEEGEELGVLDLLVRRYYVTEEGINIALGKLTPADRKYVISEMDGQIDTMRREREFLAEVDRRAGDQTVEEVLTEEEIDEIFRGIMSVSD